MSVIDNLIFDRTQADVDRVFELKNKILTGGGLSALTSEEQSEYMAGTPISTGLGRQSPIW